MARPSRSRTVISRPMWGVASLLCRIRRGARGGQYSPHHDRQQRQFRRYRGRGTTVKLSDVSTSTAASRRRAPSCRSRTTTSDRMPAIPVCRPPRWCSSKRSSRRAGPTGPAGSPEDRDVSQGGDCNRNSRRGNSRCAIQPHPWIGHKMRTGRLRSPSRSFLSSGSRMLRAGADGACAAHFPC